jgi:lysophospholipase L1-like esterase
MSLRSPIRRRVVCLVLAWLGGLISSQTSWAQSAPREPTGPEKWAKEIAKFEQLDADKFPPVGGVVFTGSSTIRGWKTLAEDFPGVEILNRGFGGCEIADCAHYAARIVIPYQPRKVFLGAGGNDIHRGKSPEQVAADFQTFVRTVHAALPETEIYFISLNPRLSRIEEVEANRTANELIAAFANTTSHVTYIDTWTVPLGADGVPRPELFVEDRLHFNREGYRLLAERIRPHLP